MWQYSENPLTGASNAGGVWKLAIFDQCLASSRVIIGATIRCYKQRASGRGKFVIFIAGVYVQHSSEAHLIIIIIIIIIFTMAICCHAMLCDR